MGLAKSTNPPSSMRTQTMENDTKLREYDPNNVDYYVREARRLRSEYVAELGRVLGKRVKGLLRSTPSKLNTHH